MVYKSQLIGYKKPTDHQNLSVFQLPYENQPFEGEFLYYRKLRKSNLAVLRCFDANERETGSGNLPLFKRL